MISVYKNIIPFFSVVVTAFNRSKTIERALSSLTDQSEKDWEAIVVDDGSSDDTFSIVREFCLKHRNIRYLFQSNRGQAMAKNAGIAASTGLYITFLDSDDEYITEHLELRKQIIHHYQNLDLIHGGVTIIGDPYVPDLNDTSKKIQLQDCAIGGTFVFKRESLIKLQGFRDIGYGDDTDLYNRAKHAKMMVAKTQFETYKYYRTGEDSLCNQMKK